MEKTCSLRFLLDGDFFKIADPDLPNELVILPLLLFEGVALSTDLYDIRIDACLLELQPIEDRLLFQALTATVTNGCVQSQMLNPTLNYSELYVEIRASSSNVSLVGGSFVDSAFPWIYSKTPTIRVRTIEHSYLGVIVSYKTRE